MATPKPYEAITDDDERCRAMLVHHTEQAILAANQLAELMHVDGRDPYGVLETVDLMDRMCRGFKLALDQRRRELAHKARGRK